MTLYANYYDITSLYCPRFFSMLIKAYYIMINPLVGGVDTQNLVLYPLLCIGHALAMLVCRTAQ